MTDAEVLPWQVVELAEHLFERIGWTRAAEIPRYAELPDGTLASTTVFFKVLR